MFERTLPIGSVVLLKNATKKVMVIGYCMHKPDEENVIYDYAGCMFPEGVINMETTVLFNHDQIYRIFSLGYQNEERFIFEEKLKNAIEKIKM